DQAREPGHRAERLWSGDTEHGPRGATDVCQLALVPLTPDHDRALGFDAARRSAVGRVDHVDPGWPGLSRRDPVLAGSIAQGLATARRYARSRSAYTRTSIAGARPRASAWQNARSVSARSVVSRSSSTAPSRTVRNRK